MRGTMVGLAVAILVSGCVTGSAPSVEQSTAPGQTAAQTGSAPPTPTEAPFASAVSGSGVASPAATITVQPGATPAAGTAKPTPAPTLAPLGLVSLRYRLVDRLGRPLFCDPDYYPVARADEAALAQERYRAIRADAPTYAAISAHLGIDPAATPSANQKLAIYREWKMLRALRLEPVGGGYAFDYIAAAAPDAKDGFHVTGTIDGGGTINVASRDPSGPPPCPICLARGTMISTPDGSVAVQDLRVGMAVWTADPAGAPIEGRVLVLGSTPVPSTHLVVDLELADGRRLEASPGHPLADGRRLGDVRLGDTIDGSSVVRADLVPYDGAATFDLLPSGRTGSYWADGILLRSTLRPRP